MTSDYIVDVKNLTIMFDSFAAVDDISFSVKPGEIFGFLGANGAGKTTTIRVLCGLLYPSKGKVQVAGIDFNTSSDEQAIKQKVGYMSQRFTLYNDLTIEENLAFIASLRHLSNQTYIERRDEILNFIALNRPLNTFVHDLPGGIRQQVSLAAAILHDPEIIFLDEPTAGVTPKMRMRFWELIKNLAKRGKTIFVTTHYMDEAEQCEKIALMRTGKIVAVDTPFNLKQKTFPNQLYEFTAKDKINFRAYQMLKQKKELTYFEPFGLRFHAAFDGSLAAEELKASLAQEYESKLITPTLEDVFIKTTEGNNL